jgi:NAD(P)-dependent dehydrogenase (short-subunit alcohol dehydrogenase family)
MSGSVSASLEGQAVVITGAFGALGSCVARTALSAGARVALLDRAAAPPELKQSAGCAIFPKVDLGDSAASAHAIDGARQQLGGLDVLVNIAGAFRWQTVSEGSSDTWELLYRSNVISAVNCCRAALIHMRRANKGRIINIGANAALRSAAGMGPYAAAKAAVHRLTESLAEEVKDYGITVNALLPSIIDTPANRAQMPDADTSRWVTPQQLADIIVFFAGATAQPITGALLPVTGRV